MQYKYCGKSGVQLPLLSLGLWHNFGDVDDFDNARRMILHAFEKGICHYDLANNYGPSPGSAERNFGRVLKSDLKAHRDELFISSKAGHDMWTASMEQAARGRTSSLHATRASSGAVWSISTSSTATATTV